MDYVVDDNGAGQRIDAFLSSIMTGISRSYVQKLIANGRVSLNGKIINKKNVVVEAGNEIVIDDNVSLQSDKSLLAAQDISLDVLYEDEFFAVINKPAGLVVHPGNGNRDGTVVNALLHRFGSRVSSGSEANRPGIVHRLDKDTSGALIIAKTNIAHTALAGLFASREIRKIYTGFCVGKHPLDSDVIDLPLARSRRDPIKRAVNNHSGNRAITEYRLITFNCGISHMEFILHTGRTHQIRAHCSHYGFPILRDDLYGGSQDKVQNIAHLERPFAYGVFKCFSRQALHARSIAFIHPFTNKHFEAVAPYPNDFSQALDIFGKVLSSRSAMSISSCGSE